MLPYWFPDGIAQQERASSQSRSYDLWISFMFKGRIRTVCVYRMYASLINPPQDLLTYTERNVVGRNGDEARSRLSRTSIYHLLYDSLIHITALEMTIYSVENSYVGIYGRISGCKKSYPFDKSIPAYKWNVLIIFTTVPKLCAACKCLCASLTFWPCTLFRAWKLTTEETELIPLH